MATLSTGYAQDRASGLAEPINVPCGTLRQRTVGIPRIFLIADGRSIMSHVTPLFIFDGICAIVIEIVKGNMKVRSLAINCR
jgi:hypothetical protein